MKEEAELPRGIVDDPAMTSTIGVSPEKGTLGLDG
jgi:hypothetical protein